jgi:hypothetical protein
MAEWQGRMMAESGTIWQNYLHTQYIFLRVHEFLDSPASTSILANNFDGVLTHQVRSGVVDTCKFLEIDEFSRV